MKVPSDIITCPVTEFCRLTGLGLTKTYELIGTGELESVTIGKRRLIVMDSWRAYVAAHLSKPADTSPNWKPPKRTRGEAAD